MLFSSHIDVNLNDSFVMVLMLVIGAVHCTVSLGFEVPTFTYSDILFYPSSTGVKLDCSATKGLSYSLSH